DRRRRALRGDDHALREGPAELAGLVGDRRRRRSGARPGGLDSRHRVRPVHRLLDLVWGRVGAAAPRPLRGSGRCRMTTTASAVRAAGGTRLRTLGGATVIAGLLGATAAVAIIAWPDQVTDRHYSYPFDATGFTVAQAFFAVQHL